MKKIILGVLIVLSVNLKGGIRKIFNFKSDINKNLEFYVAMDKYWDEKISKVNKKLPSFNSSHWVYKMAIHKNEADPNILYEKSVFMNPFKNCLSHLAGTNPYNFRQKSKVTSLIWATKKVTSKLME